MPFNPIPANEADLATIEAFFADLPRSISKWHVDRLELDSGPFVSVVDETTERGFAVEKDSEGSFVAYATITDELGGIHGALKDVLRAIW